VLPGLSIGLATEILVGRLVGSGRLGEAHRRARRSVGWGLGVSFGVALGAALTARWTPSLFTHDPQVLATAQVLLWMTVLLEPGRTFNLVVINALRATGDARFPVAAGVLSMIVVMAGGVWLLGVHFGFGLPGVCAGYAADEWLRGLVMAAHARAAFRRASQGRRGATPPEHGPSALHAGAPSTARARARQLPGRSCGVAVSLALLGRHSETSTASAWCRW
jgi:Na+-driven multidrug efflux pump